MGIRETLNQNRLPTVLVAVVAVGVAMTWAVLRVKNSGGNDPIPSGRCWFTIDDGRSWFADDARKLAPFEHQGKLAVRCYVYTCDGGKTKFVTHLERYSPEAKRAIKERAENRQVAAPMMGSFAAGVEVKAPGAPDSSWAKLTDGAAAAIIAPKCPDGSTNNLTPVPP